MTLKDTMVHFMTLCDGVCEGGFGAGHILDHHEGDTDLNNHTIPSPS